MTTRVKHTWNNIKDILLNEQTEILKVAGLLMLPTILTKITGQLFTLLAAARLDAQSSTLREFLVANDLPETLTNIILLGVISAVVIPILIDVKTRFGRERFLRVYSTIINVSVGLFLLVTLLIILFAQDALLFFITYISRPETLPDPQSLERIVSMMRVMMLPNLILGISAFLASGLNVYQRFLVPQLAPLFYNLGRIFGVFVLLPLLNDSPWALVAGTCLGAVMHLLIQIPLARHLQIGYRAVVDFKDEYVQKLFRISLPRTLALAIDETSLTIVNFIAFGLNPLARGSLFYATSLATVVPALFGFTFAVASFPTLTQMYINKEYYKVNELIIKTLNQIVFLSMPIVVAMLILRLPLVRLSYGLIPGTQFDRESTTAVAWVLLFFTFGLIFWATKWYLYRVFYIAHNTFVPLLISALSMMVTVVLTILLTNLFSHSDTFSLSGLTLNLENLLTKDNGRAAVGGVSLALSITYTIETCMLLFWANKVVVKLNWRELFAGLTRKAIPTLAMATVMYTMYKMWDRFAFPIDATPGFVGSTTINLIVLTVITVFTSFMVYYLLCFVMQVEELKILRRFLNPVFKIGGLAIK